MTEDARSPYVLGSAKFSLFVQLIFTGVTAASLFLSYTNEHQPLFYIALLETVSQAVEFVYYCVVIYGVGAIYTWTRYIDWFISTPVMLVSTAGFFIYVRDDDTLDRLFVGDDLAATLGILGFNTLMLVFGLLAELGKGNSALMLSLIHI